MTQHVLVIHERIGRWARQLRPRFSERPARVVETRSTFDLEAALAGAVCPIVLIDLARRVRAGLDDLARATSLCPDALVLVLDPHDHEGCALLAREAGATHVIGGPVTPPEVEALLSRWLGLARRRVEAGGWARSSTAGPGGPDPWGPASWPPLARPGP